MTDDKRAYVLALHSMGVPSSHIARRAGVPRREVNQTIRKARVKR